MKLIKILPLVTLVLAACSGNKNNYDASGTFETEEVIISAEASGVIKQFDIEEGKTLQAGQFIGYIDTVQLYLKKRQLEAQVTALLSKRPDIAAQLGSLQVQLQTAEREQQRVNNSVKAGAATTKQLDDAVAQVDMIRKQIVAQQSSLSISSEGLTQETTPLFVQVAQLNDQLMKSRLVNPINGTVLVKYAERDEIANPGKPLYKIADMSTLILRAYITGNQLGQVKLNQTVKVLVDDNNKSYREYPGTLTWISSQAEFTPKTIQTKDERANLVYAVKIKVKNDSLLKLGMYGEVKF